MAKIWSEKFSSRKDHRNLMYPIPGIPNDHERRPASLQTHKMLFVRVCSFKFSFQSLDQLQACLNFYDRKIQQSSRQDIGAGDHWECERWFERLPLYLREEPKRLKIVKALREALAIFAAENADTVSRRPGRRS